MWQKALGPPTLGVRPGCAGVFHLRLEHEGELGGAVRDVFVYGDPGFEARGLPRWGETLEIAPQTDWSLEFELEATPTDGPIGTTLGWTLERRDPPDIDSLSVAFQVVSEDDPIVELGAGGPRFPVHHIHLAVEPAHPPEVTDSLGRPLSHTYDPGARTIHLDRERWQRTHVTYRPACNR